MRSDARRRNGGFTLLEVLVAFAIAALALSLLARAALDGVRSADLSARYAEALVRARSHLAGVPSPPVPGEFEGDDGGGYHWRLRVASDFRILTRQNLSIALYDVTVAISWDEGDRRRVVTLATKRAALAAGS